MRTPESAISLRPSGSVLDSFDVSASMVFIFVRKAHDRESAGARKAARRASILSRLNEREAERIKRSEARIEQRRPRQQQVKEACCRSSAAHQQTWQTNERCVSP